MRDYPKGVKRIYDDKFSHDRYAVYYDVEGSRDRFWEGVFMSPDPFDPQGFGQHGEGMLGRHNGDLINFADLPADCQKVVKADLKEIQYA